MKKFSVENKPTFIVVAVVLILFSCSKSSDLTLGNNFIQTDASVVYTDTLSVDLSTLILDSIQTAGKNVALVGRYNDPNIGMLKSKSFIPMGSDSYVIDENSVFDSLVLVVKPTGYYYGDTLTRFNLRVLRVKEVIEIDNDEGFLSNLSDFEVYSNPIGEVDFVPKPNLTDEIRIPITDELGLDLAEKFKSSLNPFGEEGFSNYFRGIMLESDENSNSILGFSVSDTSSLMLLYYHTEGYDEVDSVIIKINEPSLQFNQIKSDISNSVISKLSEKPISSVSLNNNSYVQGGTGIVTRIDFPTLTLLKLQNRRFEVIKAELTIQPSIEMDMDYLPQNLMLYVTNKHNDFIAQVTDDDGNTVTGSLFEDYIYRENTCYTWNITTFINLLINNPDIGYNGLLLLPENYDSKFDNVIVANQKKSEYRTKLKLYILYYE